MSHSSIRTVQVKKGRPCTEFSREMLYYCSHI